MMRPLVAIVGRPNVGKSTLFNRIVGRRQAIVEDQPGVTRDRHYGEASWAGREVLLVDTGGFEPDAEDELRAGMRAQAQLAVEEAAAIILVLDAMDGVTGADQDIAEYLRRSGRPVVIAANKIDSEERERSTSALAEIHALGLPVVPCSAEHGRRVGELLDEVLERVEAPAERETPDDEQLVRLAIVGRPNVGKSTLANALLGEDRFLATAVAGTTRDSLDATLRYRGRTFVLTDTAGLRRKRSISLEVERYSTVRALKAVERAHVVVLVLDATELGVTQDARLASLTQDRGRGLVLAVNKWDLVKEGERAADRVRAEVAERFPDLGHAPVVLVSALEKKRVFTLLEVAAETHDWLHRRVPTPEINAWLEAVTAHRPPPVHKSRAVRLLYAAQVGVAPPRIVISTNRPEGVPESYRRYLVNQFREAFGFPGVPVRLTFRSRRG